MTVHQMFDKLASSASYACLLAIEEIQEHVESCIAALEEIMAGELSDIAQFNAARLRLRQANVSRTRVALEASRHLMTVLSDDVDLQGLQRAEIDHSQMISDHVQRWTVDAIKRDWDEYRRQTRRILAGVRSLIAAERTLLCLPLRTLSQERGSTDASEAGQNHRT